LAKAKLLQAPEEREFVERTAGRMKLSTLLACAGWNRKPQYAEGLVAKFSVDFSVELLSCIVKKYFEMKASFDKAKTKQGQWFSSVISERVAEAGVQMYLDSGGDLPNRTRKVPWHKRGRITSQPVQYRVPAQSERDACNAFIIEKFISLLDKYGYLDIALEQIGLLPRGLSDASPEEICEGDPLAWVERCLVSENGRGGHQRPLALAIHHAVSRQFYEESLADDNSKPFMRGKGGRSHSYFRSAFESSSGNLLAKNTVASIDYPSDRCTRRSSERNCCCWMLWPSSNTEQSWSSFPKRKRPSPSCDRGTISFRH
jgi:hypothetical protein